MDQRVPQRQIVYVIVPAALLFTIKKRAFPILHSKKFKKYLNVHLTSRSCSDLKGAVQRTTKMPPKLSLQVNTSVNHSLNPYNDQENVSFKNVLHATLLSNGALNR